MTANSTSISKRKDPPLKQNGRPSPRAVHKRTAGAIGSRCVPDLNRSYRTSAATTASVIDLVAGRQAHPQCFLRSHDTIIKYAAVRQALLESSARRDAALHAAGRLAMFLDALHHEVSSGRLAVRLRTAISDAGLINVVRRVSTPTLAGARLPAVLVDTVTHKRLRSVSAIFFRSAVSDAILELVASLPATTSAASRCFVAILAHTPRHEVTRLGAAIVFETAGIHARIEDVPRFLATTRSARRRLVAILVHARLHRCPSFRATILRDPAGRHALVKHQTCALATSILACQLRSAVVRNTLPQERPRLRTAISSDTTARDTILKRLLRCAVAAPFTACRRNRVARLHAVTMSP